MLLGNLASAKSPDEASLRAAVVLGILRFTEWQPPIDSSKPITICFLGDVQSKDKLVQASSRVTVKGHAVDTKNVISLPQTDVCSVLIIGDEWSGQYPTGVGSQLTVCDSCRFGNQTAINLVKRNQRIGFEINMPYVQANNISFSSSLLELASRINR
ncbi:YfiR family protein [Saccharobesus litoralis]|nr:YfiR family protein [Saccharobesus litoralis]